MNVQESVVDHDGKAEHTTVKGGCERKGHGTWLVVVRHTWARRDLFRAGTPHQGRTRPAPPYDFGDSIWTLYSALETR